jgi:hypothetical protein
VYDAYGAYQAGSIAAAAGRHTDYDALAFGEGAQRFQSYRWLAKIRQASSKLTGRSRRLLDLDDIRRTKTIEGIHELGCVTVEVARIRGSECRVCDFDADFLPLSDMTMQRWAGIYAARRRGASLPAISLVQVSDVYFVRDGHHRVSVARVLGEQYIEANVQVWAVEGEMAAAPAMAMQLVTAS